MDELRLPDRFDGLVLSLVSWAIVALIAIVLIAPVVVTGQSGPLPPVYHPSRLVIKQQCITVTGTIVDATNGKETDAVRHEADGDTHGWLKLDPPFVGMLNIANNGAQQGHLVFELVCHYSVTQADAQPSCSGFTDHSVIPPVGSHVEIRGTYVQDKEHQHWHEIHPVSSIVVKP